MPTKWLQERHNGSKNDTGMPPRRASRGDTRGWVAFRPEASLDLRGKGLQGWELARLYSGYLRLHLTRAVDRGQRELVLLGRERAAVEQLLRKLPQVTFR